MATIPELFSAALKHHQAGELPQAERLYRQILQQDSRHADSLHLLGVIAHQVGRHDIAVDLMQQSIAIDPNQSHVLNNLGGAYRALQRFDEACRAFQQAIALSPNYVEALTNLGGTKRELGLMDDAIEHYRQALTLRPANTDLIFSLGHALQEHGLIAEAIQQYQSAMKLKMGSVGGYINLGNSLKSLGDLASAAECYRSAIELDPLVAIAYLNLGVVLKEQGDAPQAVECYRRAIELDPLCAEAFNNLGIVRDEQGELNEAIACFQQALSLNPQYADAHNNLGISLSRQGKLPDAIACYRRALELNAYFAHAMNNLGVALKEQGKSAEAVECFRKVLQWRPRDVEALGHLGVALKSCGLLDEAVDCCRQALATNPDHAETHNHLGNVLKDQGRLDEAVEAYRRAIELDPQHVNAHSNLVYTLLFCPGYDNAALKQEHDRWNQQHALPLANKIQPHTNDRTANRRLRIGYVSPCFRNHVVGRNLIPLFEHHDHDKFEIFCYADLPDHDDLSQRFQAASDVWRNTIALSDEQLAELIRSDQIDILVDLTLHMAEHRLLVFARKPAPVQVTFAGYPGTTGLKAIDYRLTDPHLDPPGLNDQFYTEQSIRLKHSFWCYDPLESTVEVNELPALTNRWVTFGCLNNFCKVNEPTMRLWARVLNAVDHSRITVLSTDGSHRERAWQLFESEGISRDRVKFVGNRPRQQYLKYYHEIDLGLDTLPYNGHSTSLDSFWMGVPVITLTGSTVVGRAGLCQLMNLGLPEYVADTADGFVHTAAEVAKDLTNLAALRSTLRSRLAASQLMNAQGFTDSIEAAYREIWQRWCA